MCKRYLEDDSFTFFCSYCGTDLRKYFIFDKENKPLSKKNFKNGTNLKFQTREEKNIKKKSDSDYVLAILMILIPIILFIIRN